MHARTAGLLPSLLAVLAGCQGTQPDPHDSSQPIDPATHARWMLFGEALLETTCDLLITRDDEAGMSVLMGAHEAEVSGGWVLQANERARVRKLAYTRVLVALGTWPPEHDAWGVVCSGDCVGIGPADRPEWERPASALHMLRNDTAWRSSALAMEQGAWAEAMNSSWREGDAEGLRTAIERLSAGSDRIALARDIVGWFTRTVDSTFPDIQPVRVRFGTKEGTITNLRTMAMLIVRECLGVPRVKPMESGPPERDARRLWILTRMWELCRQASEQPTGSGRRDR